MKRTLGMTLVLIACKGSTESGTSPAPSVASTSVRGLKPAMMIRHEVLAIGVRDALIQGDLDAAHRNATDLGSVKMGGSPEIDERAQAMRSAASRIATAPDLAAASRATGELVRTCSDCHARLTGPTRLEIDPAPRTDDSARRARMRRHVWAMNELWDGLVGNSEEPWRAGAAVLADPALGPAELVPSRSATPEIEQMAKTLQKLGARAQATSDTTLRSEAYGEILSTCAGCHARTR